MNLPPLKTAMVVVGGVLCGIWAHRYAVQDRVRQLDRLRTEIVGTESGPHIDAVITELTRTASRFAAIEARVPLSPGVADVVARLTADLDELGTDRRTWNISPTVRSGEFEETGLDLAFRGSTESAYALLSRVASYPRVVRVMSVSILANDDETTQSRSVEVKLQIVSRLKPGRLVGGRQS